jgi:shikimate dehydrogenase
VTRSSGRRAAVLGHPVAHSLSPVLHRAAYAELGLDWQYTAVDITPAQLPDFLDRCGDEWVGLSLTMPLKETVIGLLDVVDDPARSVRSVNTVIFDGGQRRGVNTDIDGLAGILAGADLGSPCSATVVGAGATARSAVAALAGHGVTAIDARARRADAASELAALAVDMGVPASAGEWPVAPHSLTSDVVVSTVPAEAGRGLWVPADPGLLIDVIYHPWPTPLAAAWTAAGGVVVGGLELLVGQAVRQVELMTGRRPDAETLRQVGMAALDERTRRSAPDRRGVEKIAQEEQ